MHSEVIGPVRHKLAFHIGNICLEQLHMMRGSSNILICPSPELLGELSRQHLPVQVGCGGRDIFSHALFVHGLVP